MTKTKTKYKKTGIEWMPEIPEHWAVKKNKHLFIESYLKSEYGIEELLSVSQYTGVTKKKDNLSSENDMITNAESLVGYKIVKQNDLVINIMLAWNGCLGVSKYNGITSLAYCVYSVLEQNVSEYFGYLFNTYLYKVEFLKNSTGIIESRLRLYSDKFFNINSIVPPIPEQERIVEYIKSQSEKINNFIEKKLKFIELLKEQRQSIINETVTKVGNGWDSKRLKNISFIKFSSVDKHNIEGENQVKLCNYVDVYKNDFITNNLNFMYASASISEIEKFKLFKNDIIITKDSEEANDIAVPALVIEELDNVVCGYHLAIIRCQNEILSEFLFRKFQSNELSSYFEINATGVTRVGLSISSIENVVIDLPKSLEEQQAIVNHIKNETSKIDIAISKTEREIELIKEYKESMIAEAVMGRLV